MKAGHLGAKVRIRWGRRIDASSLALDLGPPPAHADEQESPVAEEFWRLPFEGMPNKLKNPSQHKQAQRIRPQPVHENAAQKNRNGDQDSGNAQRVARPVDGVLMARGVLRNPLLVGASA